jgi:hypothetical protein
LALAFFVEAFENFVAVPAAVLLTGAELRGQAQVLGLLLASSVDHDEWFRDEVEKGRASAREGRLIEHDDVVARMDQRDRR